VRSPQRGSVGVAALRTVLICHEGSELHSTGIASWLAAGTDLRGIVLIREPRSALLRRARRQLRRHGPLALIDALALRLYYALRHARRDAAWRAGRLAELTRRYPPQLPDLPRLRVADPNGEAARRFIEERQPELMLAFSKALLAPAVYSIPRLGTFVLHPGVTPEYRNAHGCFWALVNRDLDKVAITLLRIDEGVDTGPVYGYFGGPFDELNETHVVIQQRLLLDNLGPIMETLRSVAAGRQQPIDTSGRPSAAWGQPRLSSYWRWKRAASRRARAGGQPSLP
jgi:hypothetical protein